MRKNDIYKKIVLGILFVFPLLVYLFFASGKNNFAKLPILTTSIDELPENLIGSTPQLKEHITILGYWGGSLENKKAEALNLNEKIYKRFYQFDDFQFVLLVDSSRENQVEELKKDLKEGWEPTCLGGILFIPQQRRSKPISNPLKPLFHWMKATALPLFLL